MEHTKHKLKIPRAGEFTSLLEASLPEKTFLHTMSTARYMAELSARLSISYEDAVGAGLLHDLKKGIGKDELLHEAEAYGIELTPAQRENPKLLHGPVAAEHCRSTLGIASEAVYEAIYWHTTGRPGLGLMGLALYFADYAEPLRKRPEAEHAREMCESHGFYPALYFVATQKTQYVRNHTTVDPISEAFYAWIERELVSQGHIPATGYPASRMP